MKSNNIVKVINERLIEVSHEIRAFNYLLRARPFEVLNELDLEEIDDEVGSVLECLRRATELLDRIYTGK